MKLLVWGILLVSALLLLIMLLRNRAAGRWFVYLGVNVVAAAFLLYFINLMSTYTHFTLPINGSTLGTVGLLGIPGLLLLVALKLVLL
jgi:inhibitor of the pro-sigma K processing machinery